MAKVAIVHFKSKTYSNKTHPVRLRITHKGKLKYYKILSEDSCLPGQWDDKAKEFKSSFGKNYKRSNASLAKRKSEAQKIILDLEDKGKSFSFEAFERKFLKEESDLKLLGYFDDRIKTLLVLEEIGNAKVYKETSDLLRIFLKDKDIYMTDFDYKKLIEFENFLRQRGNKETTISNRMRTIRALFNKARNEEGLENYPFEKYNFGKLRMETRKRALYPKELINLLNHKSDDPKHLDAINLFKFIFFARGISFDDLARLNKSYIIHGRIYYRRSKSKSEYELELHDAIKEILNYFEKKNKSNMYLFPILHEDIHKTEQQKKDRIKKMRTIFNKNIKEIAEKVGIENHTDVTTYVMRHSWASVARSMKVPLEDISKGMGHKDLKTTMIYLKKFDEDSIHEANKRISDILN